MNQIEIKIWKYITASSFKDSHSIDFFDFVIDGVPLNTIFGEHCLVPNYCFGKYEHQEKTHNNLLGEGSTSVGVELFVCPYCSECECGEIVIDVIKKHDSVTWKNFRFISSSNIKSYKIGPYIFNYNNLRELLDSVKGSFGYEWPWELLGYTTNN